VRTITLFFGCGLLSLASQQTTSAGSVLAAGDARRLSIPIYAVGQASPIAVLRIERLSTEFEKRGLFRVGMLPKVVFTGVSLELDSLERLPLAFANLQRLLEHSRQFNQWEMRLVRISVRGEPANTLALGRVTPETSAVWRLENLSYSRSDRLAITLASGRLSVNGQLELEASSVTTPLLVWLADEPTVRATSGP